MKLIIAVIQPEELPKPTYWPFFLALGVVLIFWGYINIVDRYWNWIYSFWNSCYRMDYGDL
jgi:hypothetical protein